MTETHGTDLDPTQQRLAALAARRAGTTPGAHPRPTGLTWRGKGVLVGSGLASVVGLAGVLEATAPPPVAHVQAMAPAPVVVRVHRVPAGSSSVPAPADDPALLVPSGDPINLSATRQSAPAAASAAAPTPARTHGSR